MDFIKRLLLILILVLTTCSFDVANCATIKAFDKIAEISAVDSYSNLFDVANKECALVASRESNTIISNRRDETNNGVHNENATLIQLNQAQQNISYFYNSLNLDGETELALLFLLYQIQPNAP